MSETYDVVLLVEQPLSRQDAVRVRGLHTDVADPVRYHVMLPVEDAAAQVESALGSIAASEVLASPAMVMDSDNVEAMQRELLDQARDDVTACIDRLTDAGADVLGEVVTADPIDALITKVADVDAAEVIVLTRSHVVSEFFHLDWTSRARRKLGVPVLHLLEHENFDEQAGGGEGVSGF